MNTYGLIRMVLTCLLGCFLVLPSGLRAEYYRYVTRDGQVHYVDDLTLVPEQYRDQVETFRETDDHS